MIRESEISEIFEVQARIRSDLPHIPWEFSKSKILNIQKVQIGSDITLFEFFEQST